jgi:outer membrane receptor protein involved in Fe transport
MKDEKVERNYCVNLNRQFLVLLLLTSNLFAASGKVSGRIISAETGEPLPGVNVIIEEVSLGAATELTGEYVILNVPSGSYPLHASYIGFAKHTIKGLSVYTDRTTRQEFSLKQEDIEGEEVIVVAERPLIQKDLTASQKTRTAEDIKDMPVETFLGVLTTQAGVNQGAGGELHIRGGRYNEVGYYIDGISVTNPFFTNSLATNVANKAIEEMRVVSGAFNAEYGNAMSGIVNLEIKEGGPTYEGSFSMYTGDYLSSDTKIFMNIDEVNYLSNQVIEGTLNGPVPLLSTGRKFTFNVSGRYSNSDGYLYGKREHLPDDYADFRVSDYWYIELGGDNKYVPMNPSNSLNMLTKLTLRITPKLKVSTQMLHDQRNWKSYNHAYKYNPDGTYNHFTANDNFSLKLSQVFTKTFYEANVFYSTTDFSQYVYEDPFDERYVSTNTIQGAPPTTTFVFGGTQMGHYYRESISKGGKFDLTSQITSKHEIKIGVSGRLDDLEEDNFTVLYDGYNYPVPTVLPANDSPSHNYYNKNAFFASSYIQDKIEYTNMVVNAGIRYDYFDPNDNYIVDQLNPEGEREEAKPKSMISPRLGVSFPITDRGVLHFSYGHFYQMPTLRRLYKTSIFGANLSPTIGYSNLKPEKTVMYEFGLQQQLSHIIAVDVSAYYKDIRDLLAVQSIDYQSPTYGPASYSIYLNKDYATVKGFAISLTKRYDRFSKTSAFIDYAYQMTDGNDVNSGSFYFNALTGEEEEKRIVPLNWDQWHVFNATITISDPNNWGISVIGKLSSGWPYTPDIPNANYVPESNSARKPWQKSVNVRVYKTVNVGKMNVVIFTKIFNLFDTRNERYVYDDTGRSGYTFINRTNQETEAFIEHYGEPGVHTWEEYQVRPHYYSTPRSVQMGLSLDF